VIVGRVVDWGGRDHDDPRFRNRLRRHRDRNRTSIRTSVADRVRPRVDPGDVQVIAESLSGHGSQFLGLDLLCFKS
jgi:hypothetical protein